jgi:hypothetical protein
VLIPSIGRQIAADFGGGGRTGRQNSGAHHHPSASQTRPQSFGHLPGQLPGNQEYVGLAIGIEKNIAPYPWSRFASLFST